MCARLACAIDVLGCCRSEAMASYLHAMYHSEDSVMTVLWLERALRVAGKAHIELGFHCKAR
jgi:hypothetical protein